LGTWSFSSILGSATHRPHKDGINIFISEKRKLAMDFSTSQNVVRLNKTM
jgi:hypothetical protein